MSTNKKNLRRVSVVVTAQTLWHLNKMAAMNGWGEKAIEALEPTARMLLRFRYIDGLPWEEVCVRMNYSWRQTHRMHSKALEALKEGEEHEKRM